MAKSERSGIRLQLQVGSSSGSKAEKKETGGKDLKKNDVAEGEDITVVLIKRNGRGKKGEGSDEDEGPN
ncbi:hypothetical protein IFR04_008832 [Cadophora malorum]|uniref:Uncharacterized protein n=1 Tax=Cadophora malorum TaxID=108018 RepID=A0A8H7TE70_9HELO|nr:hypothetical protein IFR04_008832 [Cadophora malorum]